MLNLIYTRQNPLFVLKYATKEGDSMNDKLINKNIISHIGSIIFVIIFLLISTIFVYYPNKQALLSSYTFLKNQENFYLEELSDGIKLAEAFPISDEEGINTDLYQFKIVNNSDKEIHYQLLFKNQLDKIEARNLMPLSAKYLRYSIQKKSSDIKIDTLPESEIIYDDIIPANSEVVFDFRIWIGENFDIEAMGKTFIGQMEVVEI